MAAMWSCLLQAPAGAMAADVHLTKMGAVIIRDPKKKGKNPNVWEIIAVNMQNLQSLDWLMKCRNPLYLMVKRCKKLIKPWVPVDFPLNQSIEMSDCPTDCWNS